MYQGKSFYQKWVSYVHTISKSNHFSHLFLKAYKNFDNGNTLLCGQRIELAKYINTHVVQRLIDIVQKVMRLGLEDMLF